MLLTHHLLLRFGGLFTWFCVCVVAASVPFFQEELAERGHLPSLWLALATFGAGYWHLSRTLGQRHSASKVLTLALLTVAALIVSWSSRSALGGVLLLVVAGVSPWVLPLRYSVPWVVVQTVVLALLVSVFVRFDVSDALVYFGLFLGYSTFTFVTSVVGRRQLQAKEELRQVNSELRATQTLLAESSRMAERVRIARELHDLVGHHLTALSLNLEVASHLARGKAQEHIRKSQSLAKLLLGDVREVVGSMRKDDSLELTRALQSLAEGVPRPQIHMTIPEEFTVEDPRRAQVLLRCTQEIITNAVKHANADNLWITFRSADGGLEIEARDDGQGVSRLSQGNGLAGMAERLKALGGRLAVDSDVGKGFRLDAWMPAESVL